MNSKGGIEHEKGLCKNGPKSAVRWKKKKNTARNCVWTFCNTL